MSKAAGYKVRLLFFLMFTDKYGILVEDAKDRFIRGKSYEKIISLYAHLLYGSFAACRVRKKRRSKE